jgi:hypothetical protein
MNGDDFRFVLVAVALLFLFSGTPDVFDAIQGYVVAHLKGE